MDCPYINWYFNRHATPYASAGQMLMDLGARPSRDHKLRRVPNTKKLVWITEAALKAAREGRFEPPQESDPELFKQLVSGSMRWHQRQMEEEKNRETLQNELDGVLANITNFVLEKGYSELDALNPLILPDKQKLNEARDYARKLIWALSMPGCPLRRLNKKRRGILSMTKRREQEKQARAHVRVYTGRRGRPFERFLERKIPVSQLTPAQKERLGIPPHQDFIESVGPSGRRSKRRLVTVRVENPRAAMVDNSP